jgi:hypothetical protein
MSDEHTVRLLEEIRDLQRQHLESHREALRNQAESVRMQRDIYEVTRRRFRLIPYVILVVLALVGVVLLLMVRWIL